MEAFKIAEESPVRSAQIELIRKGMASLHPEESSISDMDFAILEAGNYDALSIKAQYWVGKYYREGERLKEAEATNIQKIYQKPATIGEVTMIVHDLVHGENGIKQGLDTWSAGVNRQIALMGEALRLKGLLTPEDLELAAKSLVDKQDAEIAEIRKALEQKSVEVIENITNTTPEQPVEPTIIE